MDDKICKEKIDSILEELQYAITDIRSGESLPIKWKSKSDKTTLKLYQLIKMMEWRDMSRPSVRYDEDDKNQDNKIEEEYDKAYI